MGNEKLDDLQLNNLTDENRGIQVQDSLIVALASVFSDVYVVNMQSGKIKNFIASDYMDNKYGSDMFDGDYNKAIAKYVENEVFGLDRVLFDDIITIDKWKNQLSENKEFVLNYRTSRNEKLIWHQCRIIKTSSENQDFIFAVKNIDEEIKLHKKTEQSLQDRMNVIRAMGHVFSAIYYLNFREDTFVELSAVSEVNEVIGASGVTSEKLVYFIENMVSDDSKEEMREFLDFSTLEERIGDKTMISKEYFGNVIGWGQAYFIVARRDEDGKITNLIYATRTINDEKTKELDYKKDLEEQRALLQDALIREEKAAKAKNAFLNNMSHDIRTPMNAIIGFASLAEKNIEDPEKAVEYIKKIQSSSTLLLSYINDMLDLSSIESGKLKIKEKECSLHDIVNNLKNMLQSNMNERMLNFIIDTTGVINDQVLCDNVRINQMLLNCISNSMKFTSPGGIISVTVTETPNDNDGISSYHFKVSDTGIGMSKEFVKHIFEPFEREKTSTVSGINGTGIGMTITKNIVDMLKGTIVVESEEHKGTDITIDIDLKLVGKKKDSDAMSQFDGISILLVEDNPLNMEIATEILTSFGFKVDTADDGDVAVEIMRKAKPGQYKAILMDIQMPTMDGYEASKHIRALENKEIANIPIIAMTANAEEQVNKEAFDAGMTAYVAKPIDVKRLTGTLAQIL